MTNESSIDNSSHEVSVPYFLHVPRSYHYDNFLIALIAINALIAVLATCSNVVVVYTILRSTLLKKPSNTLLLGLAISDLLNGVMSQPCFCCYKYFEFKRDISLYKAFRKAYQIGVTSCTTASYLVLTAITADRYLAVRLHLRYQEIITCKRYYALLSVICLLGLLTVFSRMTGIDIQSKETFQRIIFIFSGSAILPNIFFLVKISLAIRRHSVQIQAQQQSVQQSLDMPRYKKSVNTMYFVVGAFVLCYFPVIGAGITVGVLGQWTYPIRCLLNIAESLVMMNGLLNPIIYCWKSKEIREAIVNLLRIIANVGSVNPQEATQADVK